MFYLKDFSSQTSYWASENRILDEWNGKLFEGINEKQPSDLLAPNTGRKYWLSPAPDLETTPPKLEIISDKREGDLRILDVHINSEQPSEVTSIFLDRSMDFDAVMLNNNPVKLYSNSDTTRNRRMVYIKCYSFTDEGIHLQIRTKSTAGFNILLRDESYGLPNSPQHAVDPLPSHFRHSSGRYSNTTIITKWIEIPPLPTDVQNEIEN